MFDGTYCQCVRRNGAIVYPVDGFPVTTEYGLQAYSRSLRIASAPGAGLFVAWNEQINGLNFYQKCERIPEKLALTQGR